MVWAPIQTGLNVRDANKTLQRANIFERGFGTYISSDGSFKVGEPSGSAAIHDGASSSDIHHHTHPHLISYTSGSKFKDGAAVFITGEGHLISGSANSTGSFEYLKVPSKTRPGIAGYNNSQIRDSCDEPKHKPSFKVEVQIPDSKKFSATGNSKKIAQQNAAKKLIKDLNLS